MITQSTREKEGVIGGTMGSHIKEGVVGGTLVPLQPMGSPTPLPYEMIACILSYYNDIHKDHINHLVISQSTGRIRLKIHTNPRFISRLNEINTHKIANPPMDTVALFRNESELYNEVCLWKPVKCTWMSPITLLRMPSYPIMDYYYEPIYGILDAAFSQSIFKRPMSDALGDIVTRFHRGWKYDVAQQCMNQMIYHASFLQNEDMVFYSDTDLSYCIFEKNGMWEWDESIQRWVW